VTINEIKRKLDASASVETDKPCVGVYAGDFLSRVMSRAPSGCVWLTVMSNVNVAGVAALAEVSAVVLCEGVKPDAQLTEKCRQEGISLLTTSLGMYEACVRLAT
jgi:hypothetical protein